MYTVTYSTLQELISSLLKNPTRVSVSQDGSDAIRERYCDLADASSQILMGLALAIRDELVQCDHPKDQAAVSFRTIVETLNQTALALVGLEHMVREGALGPTPGIPPERCECQPWDVCSCW